jgi:hypothetical protein
VLAEFEAEEGDSLRIRQLDDAGRADADPFDGAQFALGPDGNRDGLSLDRTCGQARKERDQGGRNQTAGIHARITCRMYRFTQANA